MTDEQTPEEPQAPEETAEAVTEAAEATAEAPEAAADAPAAEAAPDEPATTDAESAEAPAEGDQPAAAAPATDTPPAADGEAAPAPAEGEAAQAVTTRRRGRRDVAHGQAHIRASFNNTIISITDQQGNSLAWTSGGSVGFKGSRKSTPYAAQVAAEQAARRAGEFGVRKLDVIVRGSGAGRETAVRTLQNMGMEVTGIIDITPTPHNGCRPKKKRRN